MIESKKKLWICLLLSLGTAVLYWPVVHHDFINFDDHEYITRNQEIQSGLTLRAVDWAFRSSYASNWHPVTWISHMLDCQFYGLNPAGHHLTNLLFHSVNSMLLFILLSQMTRALWRSGFVAALFAWHPLRVESVAWVAERKDLLCGLFWILTMLAYVRYVRETEAARCPKARIWYGTALLLFALALMSKPMAVTLPLVLLIIDFWPLRRISINESSADDIKEVGVRRALSALLLEKLPFFALTIASSIVTVLVQRGAAASMSGTPLLLRLENAVVAYASYIKKTIWPTHLAVVYPFPKHVSAGMAIGATLLLFLISVWFLGLIRRKPYLAAGWFWFLGMLVPVIGLLQVGSQSMADRYTYLPGIGLSVAIVWGIADVLGKFPGGAKIGASLGALSLVAFIVAARHQLSYWQNSASLFGHAVEVTKENYIAYGALGTGLDGLGLTNEALRMCEESVRLEPKYAEGQYNLGSLLLKRGRNDEAVLHFEAALKQTPHFANAENNLGKALSAEGKMAESEHHLKTALDLAPDDPEAHYNLGTVLLMESKVPAAIAEFSEALRLNPDYAEAHGNFAIALARLGRSQEALVQFSEQVRLDPSNSLARLNLGHAFLAQNKPGEASGQFCEALRLEPDNATAHYDLATALAKEGKLQDAAFQCREALRLQPDFKEARDELALLSGGTH